MKSQQFTHFILVNNYVIFKIKYLNILEISLIHKFNSLKNNYFATVSTAEKRFYLNSNSILIS